MEFQDFFERCRKESTISDFESYLSYCIFEKGEERRRECTVEAYSAMRDQAFDRRDEEAARKLYELSGARRWKAGEWEGALK